MRLLLLTHSFNSLTQRLYVELESLGHDVSVEFDIHDDVTREAVQLFTPDLVIAPFLKRAIPEDVFNKIPCLIVHPGPVGDRGPSALDWAILRGEKEWGVTVLQAVQEMDAGPVWAHRSFALRRATKSSLYRNEVAEAAVACVLEALETFAAGGVPTPLDGDGVWNPVMKQSQRKIDWAKDDMNVIMAKINSADGHPGVLDDINGKSYYLHNAQSNPEKTGKPGDILATANGAILRACKDGSIWIGHLRAKPDGQAETFKLPSTQVLGLESEAHEREIRLDVTGEVGYLHFPFHNGAMSTDQCKRLLKAYKQATQTPDIQTIVLMGGEDFFSNGIHLNAIEAAERPAEESWNNINAMDDLCEAIINTTDKVSVAALSGNAGAGGVFFALCSDFVFARSGVVLNPHYKNMGNLFGSEFWTYLLPKRVGQGNEASVMGHQLPIGAQKAKEIGLIDGCFGTDVKDFRDQLPDKVADLATTDFLTAKSEIRKQDEAEKPLKAYREEELQRMKLNFFGFDPSYHVARYKFVLREPKSRTPLYLAKHRKRRHNRL